MFISTMEVSRNKKGKVSAASEQCSLGGKSPVFVAPALDMPGLRQEKDLPVEKQDTSYKNHVIRRGIGNEGGDRMRDC